MVDPLIVLAGSGVAGMGLLAYKAFLEKPKNERDWMTLKDAKKYGLIGNERDGIIIGELNGVTLSDKTFDHFSFNGTTGTGKSALVLKTLLLNKRYGMFVNDPKGDLYRLTSGIRSTYGPVYRIDPSEPNSSLYNPLDDMMDSDNIYAELSMIFRSLIEGNRGERSGGDPHWDLKAIELTPAYTMQLLYSPYPELKNFASVLSFIRQGGEAIRIMYNNPSHPKCREVAATLLADAERGGSGYLSSLVSVCSNPLSLWDDVNIARITSRSSFRMEEVATSKDGPVTVYITAPARDTKRIIPFTRMMRDMMTSHLLYRKLVTLRGIKKLRPVLSIYDECQNEQPEDLDHIHEICRGYGLRLLTGWQSLDAAEEIYGKHFLGLIKSHVSFRPTTGDNVVNRLSAMSGLYEKTEENVAEDRRNLVWVKSGRRVEKVWKPRLEAQDFERWPRFGVCLYTHTGKPALLKSTDGEADPAYKKYILPEYELPEPVPIPSPWENNVPSVEMPPASEVEEDDFDDQAYVSTEDDDLVIV